jgi:hypothetical protein
MHVLATVLMGNVTWDPFIRGVLIVATAVLVLPGSVYLLLATNNGVKLGLLIALAAMFGWISMLAGIWCIFGIGDQGRVNSWTVKEIVVGHQSDLLSQTNLGALKNFPLGWDVLPSTKFADPQAAADKVLAPASFPVPQGQAAPKSPINFTSPYKSTADYVTIAAYEKGHHQTADLPKHCSVIKFWNCIGHGNEPGVMFYVGRHKVYAPLIRPAHYVVLVDQGVRPVLSLGGAPPQPVADNTQPTTYIVVVRDLGSVRQPSFVICVSAGIIFLGICDILHRRDKAIWAAQAAAEEKAEV